MKTLRKNRGITLIALVITIIVLLILAGVSLSLIAGSDGLLSKAGEAVKRHKIASAKEVAELTIMDVQTDYYDEAYIEGTYNGNKLNYVSETLKVGVKNGDYFVQEDENGKIKVYKGEGSKAETLVSGSIDENGKIQWDNETEAGTPIDFIAGKNDGSKNRTLANETAGYSYKNPVIPQGFKAIDTASAKWNYSDSKKTEVKGWNKGLVIEDVDNGNQFVWVPVDGEDVKYEKWCKLSISYLQCSDDTSVLPVSNENTQIEVYEGFYVARYEAGNPNAVNSSSSRDPNSPNNDGTIHPISKQGVKVWNYISYENAVAAAKLMVNDTSKYGNNKSGLITGTRMGYDYEMV